MTIFTVLVYKRATSVLCFRLTHDDDLYVSEYNNYKKNVINIDDDNHNNEFLLGKKIFPSRDRIYPIGKS